MNASCTAADKFEMFDRVTDPGLFPIAPGFLKCALEELSGWANKWSSLKIFLISWLLADKKDLGLRRAFSGNGA
ncbi:hypothetical protein AA0229_1625 [Gluconobacter cerinus NRIC 0229]|nr:hypothetical protein AA0229_1625 [Gluconobacter cerinus NRIC 0229]